MIIQFFMLLYLFRIVAAKHHDEAFQQLQQSGSENDESEKKTFLLTSSVGNDPCKNDHKRAIKCGYLKKQGGKIKTWHERWFTLKGDKLYYHKDVGGKYLVRVTSYDLAKRNPTLCCTVVHQACYEPGKTIKRSSGICLLVIFILLTRETTLDVKHRTIVTQIHFRRYRQYHVRLLFFSPVYMPL